MRDNKTNLDQYQHNKSNEDYSNLDKKSVSKDEVDKEKYI